MWYSTPSVDDLAAKSKPVTAELVDSLCYTIPVKETLVMSFVDVARAHFCAPARREIYVSPPEECGLPEGYVARLLKSMYGTRDAAQNWEAEYSECMEIIGFNRGIASPCVFVHSERNIRCVIHGDDFTLLGHASELDWFRSKIIAKFEVKMRGRLGPCPCLLYTSPSPRDS